jgi:hypothetical protein
MLDIAPITYYNQTSGAVGMNDWAVGLVKSILFGAVVAIVGCVRQAADVDPRPLIFEKKGTGAGILRPRATNSVA